MPALHAAAALYVGAQPVEAAYLGAEQVWAAEPPVLPEARYIGPTATAIPDDPVLHPDSAAFATILEAGTHALNGWEYAIAFYEAHESTVNVDVTNNWGPPWPFGAAQNDQPVPIPPGATPPAGTDRTIVVEDHDTGDVWELWDTATPAETSGDWEAGWGGRSQHGTTGTARHALSGASGAAIPHAALVIRHAEVEAGHIPHALGAGIPMARATEWFYPASKTDGANVADLGTTIPEGLRVQLDPSIDLDALDLSPLELIVGRALQTYGAYVIDNAGGSEAEGGWTFSLERAPDGTSGSSPGALYVAGADPAPDSNGYISLEALPWDSLRVLARWDGIPLDVDASWPGSNGDPWDPEQWISTGASTGSAATVQDGEGRLLTSAAGGYSDFLSVRHRDSHHADVDIHAVIDPVNGGTVEQYLDLRFRALPWSSTDYYKVQVEPFWSNAKLQRVTAGTPTTLGSEIGLASQTAPINVRVQAVGTTLRLKVWPVGDAEPGTWGVEQTDANFAAGSVEWALAGGAAAAAADVRIVSLTIEASSS